MKHLHFRVSIFFIVTLISTSLIAHTQKPDALHTASTTLKLLDGLLEKKSKKADGLHDKMIVTLYNVLREYQHASSAKSISDIDYSWLEDLRETLDFKVLMHEQLIPTAEAHWPTLAQEILAREAKMLLDIPGKICIAGTLSEGFSGLTPQTETPFIGVFSDRDRELRLFYIYHELGHLVHQDPVSYNLAVTAKISIESIIAAKDFSLDLEKIKLYTEQGKQSITTTTRIGTKIVDLLKTHTCLWHAPKNKDTYTVMIYQRGKEQRADLYALEKLFVHGRLSVILRRIAHIENSDFLVAQELDNHASDLERALYMIGFLVKKGLDINHLLYEWETQGMCNDAEDMSKLAIKN